MAKHPQRDMVRSILAQNGTIEKAEPVPESLVATTVHAAVRAVAPSARTSAGSQPWLARRMRELARNRQSWGALLAMFGVAVNLWSVG